MTRQLEPFPDARTANPWGPLAIGGDLAPDRLVLAYTSGIFPWFSDGEPIQWWSPDPRAVIELDGLYVSKRLARTVRSGRFRFTVDQAFERVMRGCRVRPGDGTWITDSMLSGYNRLHALGVAHSAEVWLRGDGGDGAERLVGGLYGVAIGGAFFGESMFHTERDASKVCMVHLFERLKAQGYVLFDSQVISPHTQRMGAIEIPRAVYLRRLREALRLPVAFAAG